MVEAYRRQFALLHTQAFVHISIPMFSVGCVRLLLRAGQGRFHKPASVAWSPRTYSGLVGTGGFPRLSRWLYLGLTCYIQY